MASPVLPFSTQTTISNPSIETSFFPKTSQYSLNKKITKPDCSNPNRLVSCKATNDGNKGDSSPNRFDRRDLLIGLGGLYGATNLSNDPFALAAPIAAPDLTLGGDAILSYKTNRTKDRKFAKKGGRGHGHAMAAETKNKNVIRSVFPIVLDKIVTIEIPRPKKSRSKLEKDEEEEVLKLENIQLDTDTPVKFDIYINDEDDEAPSGPENSEFAGSFTNLPHNHKHAKKLDTSFSLAISDLLEDLDVEGDDNIVVTLVPREGKGRVSVGNIKIDYIRE
ncbi:polyphenol oxidase, chloroplastic-like [Herrania umbratica]|uniref:Polyphenol oxidase, chloroplastic-like n=1 Tax=Herrania umbratica TaxID=108875 RepID=A0A6J1B566_9ROSI|nr:polyphenol oxidase, chloroplastic-like [Herrania umbratica]